MAMIIEDVIRSGESYPIAEFRRRSGLGIAAMRKARRNGLYVRRVGSRAFVLGSDWHKYLENCLTVEEKINKQKRLGLI
jgi:hypothetical protein